MRIAPSHDVVCVDGKAIPGEDGDVPGEGPGPDDEYIKYWKPIGVTCTCDRRVPGNLVDAIDPGRLRRRVFPVGRLDRDTSGLLLLTSDGELPNAVLRSEAGLPKTYLVTLDRPIQPSHVRQLENGVLITTETSRLVRRRSAREADPTASYRRTARTARTRPARAVVSPRWPNQITLTVAEGRNRQVRKMAEAIGYRVVGLHRTSFVGIDLDGLDGPGDWRRLSEDEILAVRRAMSRRDDGGTDPNSLRTERTQ
jgi:pseudouridine synthase